jgi:hypothetical protein
MVKGSQEKGQEMKFIVTEEKQRMFWSSLNSWIISNWMQAVTLILVTYLTCECVNFRIKIYRAEQQMEENIKKLRETAPFMYPPR